MQQEKRVLTCYVKRTTQKAVLVDVSSPFPDRFDSMPDILFPFSQMMLAGASLDIGEVYDIILNDWIIGVRALGHSRSTSMISRAGASSTPRTSAGAELCPSRCFAEQMERSHIAASKSPCPPSRRRLRPRQSSQKSTCSTCWMICLSNFLDAHH